MTELLVYFMVSAAALGVLGYLVGAGKIRPGFLTVFAVAVLIGLPVILNTAVYLYSGTTPQVVAPDVLGMSSHEAASILETKGLRCIVSGVSISDRPAGTVVSQLPEGGKSVKKGRVVKIVLSARERQLIMPNVISRTSSEAEGLLSSMGISIGQVLGVPSESPYGVVLEQSPLPGKPVPSGGSATITISLGKETE